MAMSENEAIKVLEKPSKHIRMVHKTKNEMEFYTFSSDLVEAFETAIQALEEIQQYRAIGTPTQIYEKIGGLDIELGKYHSIGTIEELKALKEKNEPKKPTPIDYEKYMDVVQNAKFLRGAYWCPNCKHTVRSGAYCDDCGQKLDWSE